MSDDFFDFGFTAVDESELQAVQDAQKAAGDEAVTANVTQEKLDKLYNAIIPLLNNLKKNPEKEYMQNVKELIILRQVSICFVLNFYSKR